jgi:hypothetical protein
MTVNDLKFPVLVFSAQYLYVEMDALSLTTCTKAALRNGYFKGMVIVDSGGFLSKVREAKKLFGLGPFWGYNIFFNQVIRVELMFAAEPSKTTVEEVLLQVLSSFRGRSAWRSRDDYSSLKSSIEMAPTIVDIIDVLAKAIGPQNGTAGTPMRSKIMTDSSQPAKR